jgi:oxygen-independent coproporphyrinogen III oxidase
VPFCARACPYCDFDFEVGRDPPVEAFIAALEAERRARQLPRGLPVRTVYVGGGTPSLLGPAGLGALLGWIDASFDAHAAVERTVELNPEHVDDALLDALVEAGVDRVSLGVQSLAPEALAQLGRVHAAAKARTALVAAVDRGLRVSADLIVGWPGQRREGLRADVEGLLATGVEHVSIYALTIEAGTPWEALERRGRRSRPDVDAQAERLGEAAELLEAAGLHHYEIASYARPGAQALHNLGYWTGRDYVGMGPSAASARHDADGSVERRTNARGLERWRAEPGAAADAERLAPAAAAAEGLWLGLRALDGVDVVAFARRFPALDVGWVRARVAAEVERGNLEWAAGGILRVAGARWLWHDEIGAALL